MVRHRIASYSQQSQRYVKLGSFDYVIPPEIDKNQYAKQVFIDAMEKDQKAYDKIVDYLLSDYKYSYYEKNVEWDLPCTPPHSIVDAYFIDKKKELNTLTKKAIEDARYVFPNACCTNIMCTMNLREFRHFLSERVCIMAQWEIREMAKLMLNQVKPHLPFVDMKMMKCGTTCNKCYGGKNE